MKKHIGYFIIIFFILTVSKPTARAQFYFEFAYNAGFPTSLSNFNYVIDRYNETRTYLDKQMGHINYLDGTSFSVGGALGSLFLGCGYTGGSQKRYAEMTDSNGNKQRRDLLVKALMFDMDFGFAMGEFDEKSLTIGGTMSIGGFSVKTRSGLESKLKKEEWIKINPWGDLLFTGGLFLRMQFSNPGIYIQPYFNFTPGKIFHSDVTEINEKLNPNTYENDPSPLMVNYNTFGIKIGMAIIGGN